MLTLSPLTPSECKDLSHHLLYTVPCPPSRLR